MVRRVSKSARFSRSRPAPKPKPKPAPKPVAKPKPVVKTSSFVGPVRPPTITGSISSVFAPKPVAKPAPKPVTTRGSVRFSRTPTVSKPTPKPTPKPVAKPTPKPTPKPVTRTTRFTPKVTPPPRTVVQQPTTLVKTSTTKSPRGTVTKPPVTEIIQTPTAVQTVKQKPTVSKVPLIPGVPGLISGIPLVAGQAVPFQETTKKSSGEQAFKLEGFKGEGEGFLGGSGASQARAEALDLSEKVLTEEKITLPTEEVIETIPGGDPTSETRTFTDKDGNIVTETTKTIPGDIEITSQKGGETVKQTVGQSEITPDFSDPLGSLGAGISQSALNEVIGIKNLPAAVSGGEQEEFFATPSSILFGGGIDAVTRLGGQIFDFGREVAGKKKVEPGQSITTFGIAGDTIKIDQQERGPDAFSILESSGQRASRLAVADPLFAIGDAAVQIPLLVVAPIKAASVAIKGVGAAGKFVKVASKGVGAIKGRGQISASGKIVTQPKPKTPLSTTFAEEFQASAKVQKEQAPEKAQLKSFGALSKAEKDKLTKSQRDQFETALDTAQTKPATGKGFAIGEETADFVQRRRDAAEVERLPKERISSSQIDPNLQKSIDELEAGGDPDLFKVGKVGSKEDPLADIGFSEFTGFQKSLGTGVGKLVGTGDDLGGIGGKGGKGGGTGTGGTGKGGGVISGRTGNEIFQSIGPPDLSKATRVQGKGSPTDVFGTTKLDLGTGVAKATKEPTVGISGFTSTVIDLGQASAKVTPKITKTQIDKLAKSAKISKADAEKTLRQAGEKGTDSVEFKTVTQSEGLELIQKTSQKQTKALKELEEARVALKKTKSTQKTVSSVADQKTQKQLSDLIKTEKTKAKTAGKSISAEKATQTALRKLIAAEKAKTGTKAISKSEDILFAKPRKLKGKATEEIFETIRTPKGKQAGILGGIATGVAIGAGAGIGLDQETINKPKVIQNPNVFDTEISRVVNDPTIQVTRTIQQPKQITKQLPGIVNIFREEQKPRLAITTTFDQDLITKQRTDIFTQQTQKQQPIQEIITTTQIPPGTPGFPGGGGLPFGGSRADESKETKSQRRFFRLFDVAKTPFGKIEVGLGAQVQSDKPIFEFEDVPLRSGKKRKNLGDDFVSDDFSNIFA